MLQSEPYSKLLKKLPVAFMGGLIWPHHSYNEDISVILHAYGQNTPERKKSLNNVKHNKYWAPYFNDLIPEKTEETE